MSVTKKPSRTIVWQRARTVLLVVALVFTTNGGRVWGASADPIEINVIISQTGAGAFLGSKSAQTLAVAERAVNQAGGIKGRPIKFVLADDATNPQLAIQLVNGFIAKKVGLVIGPSIVSTCAAILPVVQAGPVTYCLATPVQAADGSFMFTQGTNAKEYVGRTFAYLRARNLTRIALITATDASGQTFEHDFDAFLATTGGAGFTVVARERFNNTDLSVAAQATRIKAAAPQALLTFAIGPAFGTLLQSLANAGIVLPTFASAGNLSAAQLDAYRAFVPKDLFFIANSGVVRGTASSPALRKAEDSYFRAFDAGGVRPELLHGITWDAAMLAVDALRTLGPDATAAQIRTYFAGLKGWSGLFGTYDFTKFPQRGIGPDALVVYRWDPDRGISVVQ